MKRKVTPHLLTIWLLLILLAACNRQKASDGGSSNEKEVVCFVYHRFDDDRFPSTNTSTEHFRAHLQYLKDNGFQVLTLSDAIDYLTSAEAPKKTAVITIDDGYRSFYENGLPILKEFAFPATLFINTKTVGGTDYMDWKALEDTKNSRVEIGNHTHSHDYFLNLPPDRRYEIFKNELEKSQQLIRKNLNLTPKTFAYPFGEYDLEMIKIVREAGFKAAAIQKSGVIHSETDLMLCPRFPMAEAYAAPDKFATKASMHALKVTQVTPESPILTSGSPELTFKLEASGKVMDQLQCFIQGSECEVNKEENGVVHVKATKDISGRRRTLYTVTVPGKNGEWYWFSHLWINPKVESLQ